MDMLPNMKTGVTRAGMPAVAMVVMTVVSCVMHTMIVRRRGITL